MTHPTVVINVVGLSGSLIGEATANINRLIARGLMRRLIPVLPAVTCSVQSSMLTGLRPNQHGIVGNGWYNRELNEVHFWKQSNGLVYGEKVWETARRRDPSVTCANMFWWFNMYGTVDYSVTPRPIYKADGRKIPDIYSHPPQLRPMLQDTLGRFPLFNFWGPAASIKSSQWIAEASMLVHDRYRPTLMLIYLPHLDYGLQKLGPVHPKIPDEVRAIDRVVGRLIDYFDSKGVRIVLLSEYGIEPVDDSVHINRSLREAGAVAVREEQGLELLDPGASDAFAVADHQVAHVYVKDPSQAARYAQFCRQVPGVGRVLEREERAANGLDHERSGDLLLVAKPGRWFSYDYWLDERKAPDFARTVDIHRKPGYDPTELFIDPRFRFATLSIGWRLLKMKLGFRTVMDVIPLDTSLVRGSHGRVDVDEGLRPVLIGEHVTGDANELPCTNVRDVILAHLFEA